MSDLPPCRMVLRSKDGVEIFTISSATDAPPLTERNFLVQGSTTLQEFAPDGKTLYVHKPSVGIISISLIASNSNQVTSPFLKDSKGVQMLAVSPKGTYLLTWERFANEQPNLKVWKASTGEYLYGFIQKNLKREGWPYVQWTHDEKYAFFMATNEIRVYESFEAANIRFTDKLRVPGISSMSVPTKATTSCYLLTSFLPATKDKPARASLHKYDPSISVASGASYPALLSKSIFRAEEGTAHWSPKGDAVLMAMQTSVDTSGESYYGSTTLYLLAQDANDTVAVPLPKNSTGPVLSVSWMPNPNKPPCFAIVSGRMPAMSSLHHGVTGEPLFLFGNAHRNTIAWAPHGRFVCLAGFGNLAGGMTFWDRNKLKTIPQYDEETGIPIFPELVAPCTVGYGWSPDSQLFGVSTTSPRMNVDNGVKIFRYNGQEVTNLPWNNANYQPDRLLQAAFVPTSPDVYPDRPQSPAPRIVGDADAIAAAKNKSAAQASKPTVAPAAKQRYVPPSQRNKTSGGTSLAERLQKEKESNMTTATKVVSKGIPGAASGGKKLPVGMAPAQPEKRSKNAERRERQRANKAKAEAEAVQKKEQEEEAARKAAGEDPEKRARKLKKILKQIGELKAKDAASLNDDQKKKLASEDEVRAELAKLGL